MGQVGVEPHVEQCSLTGVTKANVIEATFGKGFPFAIKKKNFNGSTREMIKISELQQEDGSGMCWNFRGELKKGGSTHAVTGFVNIQTGKGHLEIK